MKKLVRFAAALMAVLTLTACTAEVGTSSVTSKSDFDFDFDFDFESATERHHRARKRGGPQSA